MCKSGSRLVAAAVRELSHPCIVIPEPLAHDSSSRVFIGHQFANECPHFHTRHSP